MLLMDDKYGIWLLQENITPVVQLGNGEKPMTIGPYVAPKQVQVLASLRAQMEATTAAGASAVPDKFLSPQMKELAQKLGSTVAVGGTLSEYEKITTAKQFRNPGNLLGYFEIPTQTLVLPADAGQRSMDTEFVAQVVVSFF